MGKFLKSLIRWAIFLGLIGILGAMLVPPASNGKGENVDVKRLDQARAKMAALNTAVKEKRGGKLSMSEEEINSYLYDVVNRRNQAVESGGNMRPTSMNIDLVGDQATLVVKSKASGLTISFLVTIKPREGASPPYEVVSAKVGSLPMPGPLKPFVADKLAAMFSGMPEESGLIAGLDAMEIADEVVTVRNIP